MRWWSHQSLSKDAEGGGSFPWGHVSIGWEKKINENRVEAVLDYRHVNKHKLKHTNTHTKKKDRRRGKSHSSRGCNWRKSEQVKDRRRPPPGLPMSRNSVVWGNGPSDTSMCENRRRPVDVAMEANAAVAPRGTPEETRSERADRPQRRITVFVSFDSFQVEFFSWSLFWIGIGFSGPHTWNTAPNWATERAGIQSVATLNGPFIFFSNSTLAGLLGFTFLKTIKPITWQSIDPTRSAANVIWIANEMHFEIGQFSSQSRPTSRTYRMLIKHHRTRSLKTRRSHLHQQTSEKAKCVLHQTKTFLALWYCLFFRPAILRAGWKGESDIVRGVQCRQPHGERSDFSYSLRTNSKIHCVGNWESERAASPRRTTINISNDHRRQRTRLSTRTIGEEKKTMALCQQYLIEFRSFLKRGGRQAVWTLDSVHDWIFCCRNGLRIKYQGPLSRSRWRPPELKRLQSNSSSQTCNQDQLIAS